ncbi:MAG: class II histone deacetylase [Cypionkella sp.]
MPPKTGLCFDERTLWHTMAPHTLYLPSGGWLQPMTTIGHAESPETKRRLKSLLDVSGLTEQLDVSTARPATLQDLRRVHPQSYLDRFQAASAGLGGDLGEGAAFGHGSFEIACLSAGMAMHAVDQVLAGTWANAYSISRPPGHHCLPDMPMGFCLLANIPIAIEAARDKHGVAKIAVVDWDVHHGNGTQAIFYDRADVLTISMHQQGCYPSNSGAAEKRGVGAGVGANINVPLLPGGGHAEYLAAMDQIVLPALMRFQPDLIIIASGLDANGFDPLARMQASSDTFRAMTVLVMQAARACSAKLAAIHEGGYSEALVPFCGLAIIEELSGHRTEVIDPFLSAIEASQPPAEFHALELSRLAHLRQMFDL